MTLASTSTFSVLVVRTLGEGEGLPNVRYRSGMSAASILLFAAPSMHNGPTRLAFGSNKRAYVWRSGVCPDGKRTRIMTSVRLGWRCSLPSRIFHTLWLLGVFWGGSR